MAYWRVIFKGSLGSVETWSTSVAFGIFGIASDTPDQALTDLMCTELRNYITSSTIPVSMRALMSVGATMDIVRVEKRAEDETTLNVAEQLLPSPVLGTAAATKTPQDALVISLRTSTPGARGRGRMYWPALGASLSSSFQLSTPTPANVASDAKLWLNAIGNEMNDVYIGMASALRVVLSVRSTTDHVCRDVTSLQIGSVLDTQRRRRDSLPEAYQSVPMP